MPRSSSSTARSTKPGAAGVGSCLPLAMTAPVSMSIATSTSMSARSSPVSMPRRSTDAHQLAPRLDDLLPVAGDEPRVALARAVQQRVLLREARVVGVGGDHGQAGRSGPSRTDSPRGCGSGCFIAANAAISRSSLPGQRRYSVALPTPARAATSSQCTPSMPRSPRPRSWPRGSPARPARCAGAPGAARCPGRRPRPGHRVWDARVCGTRVSSARVLGAVRALEVVGAPGAAQAWRRRAAVAGRRRDADVQRRRGLGGYGGGVPGDRRAVRVFVDVAVMSAHGVEPSSVRIVVVVDFDWS